MEQPRDQIRPRGGFQSGNPGIARYHPTEVGAIGGLRHRRKVQGRESALNLRFGANDFTQHLGPREDDDDRVVALHECLDGSQDQIPIGAEEVVRLVDPEYGDAEGLQAPTKRLPKPPGFPVGSDHRKAAALEQGAAHAFEGSGAGHAGFKVVPAVTGGASQGGVPLKSPRDQRGFAAAWPVNHQHAPGLAVCGEAQGFGQKAALLIPAQKTVEAGREGSVPGRVDAKLAQFLEDLRGFGRI